MAYHTPEKVVDFSIQAHGEFVRLLLDSFDVLAADEKETPLEAARRALAINIPALVQLLGDAALASLLWGAAGVGRRMPREHIYGSPRLKRDVLTNWDGNKAWMPIVSAAVRSVGKLRPMLDWIYEAASPAVRQQAFTVTGLASQRAVEQVQKTLVKAMADGVSFPGWYNLAKQSLATGAVGIPQARSIYRFVDSQAFHRGQDMILRDPLVGDQFPYVFVYTIRDSRLSEECRQMSKRGLNGTPCYRRDDPAYIRNRTPRHPNCRCHDSVMTVSQAARLGVGEAVQWEKTGDRPYAPAYVPYFEVKLSPRFLEEERGSRGAQYAI